MDVGSVSSVPSSVSSSSARSTPVPNTYKPLTQSSSVLALTKISDDDMKRRVPDELVHMIRRLETENRNLVAEHSSITKDVNKRMQILLLEVRGLKDINQSLQDDNQELRDLCCFLDDDRQRGRKLAREWQRFGRYTASVMRSEVSAYQEKLKELESKQQDLISDNTDLKELCLFLDQERLRVGQFRDEGDGSSNSTLAGNEEPVADIDRIELVPVSQLEAVENSPATDEYIRQLEEKIRRLEDKRGGTPQVSGDQRLGPDGNQPQDAGTKGASPNKPEAVVHAMKVLEVHENLERPQTAVGEENLDDKEKAIVREMCNVVWRKLGNVAEQESEASTPHPVYENIEPAHSQGIPAGQMSNHPSVPSDPRPVYTSQTLPHTRADMDRGSAYTSQPSSHRSEGNLHNPTSAQYSRSELIPQTGYQGQYTSSTHPPQTSQSQRPPPGPQNTGAQYGPPAPHHGNQPPKYGYVRTSKSAPVTPTPQQRSHSPGPSHHMSNNQRSEVTVRSHSPGPVHKQNPQRNQPSGLQQRNPYTRTESQSSSQSSHLYQNHPSNVNKGENYQNFPPVSSKGDNYQKPPVGGNKGDNSYENVPQGYYYTTSSSQGYSSSHDRSRDSAGTGHDYPAPTSHSRSQYMYSDQPVPSPGYTTQRGYSQPQPHQTSQGQGHYTASQNPPHYQNIQMQKPAPSKHNIRETQSSHYNPHHASTPPLPQQTSQRTTPTNVPYGQPHPWQAGPPTSGVPSQGRNEPSQYHDRQTGYMDPRGNGSNQYIERQDGRGRRDMDKYYRK